MENPDRAWGPVPEWTSKVRLAGKTVNTSERDPHHVAMGFRRESAAAWGTGWAASGPAGLPDRGCPAPSAERAPVGRGGELDTVDLAGRQVQKPPILFPKPRL